MRSSLLTKHIRGTLYLSAWRHTVSDCGSTPATESNTATAPSSTRSERSTSMVKSTWPGVSMMLMRWSFQKQIGRAHSELQSLMRISYAVFCFKKKTKHKHKLIHNIHMINYK